MQVPLPERHFAACRDQRPDEAQFHRWLSRKSSHAQLVLWVKWLRHHANFRTGFACRRTSRPAGETYSFVSVQDSLRIFPDENRTSPQETLAAGTDMVAVTDVPVVEIEQDAPVPSPTRFI